MLQGIVECPACHVRHFRLVKPDISKSQLEIRCGGCDKTVGVTADYMIDTTPKVDEPEVKEEEVCEK